MKQESIGPLNFYFSSSVRKVMSSSDLLVDAIKKEIQYVGIAFEIIEENVSMLMGHRKAKVHLVFDGKIDFTRKSW